MQLNNPSLPVQKRMSGSRLGYTGCVCVCVCVGGGRVLPYVGHIRMCRCEGYGFQAVYSGIGYINQSVWV